MSTLPSLGSDLCGYTDDVALSFWHDCRITFLSAVDCWFIVSAHYSQAGQMNYGYSRRCVFTVSTALLLGLGTFMSCTGDHASVAPSSPSSATPLSVADVQLVVQKAVQSVDTPVVVALSESSELQEHQRRPSATSVSRSTVTNSLLPSRGRPHCSATTRPLFPAGRCAISVAFTFPQE